MYEEELQEYAAQSPENLEYLPEYDDEDAEPRSGEEELWSPTEEAERIPYASWFRKGVDYTVKEDKEEYNIGVEKDVVTAKGRLQRLEFEPHPINLFDHFTAVIDKFIVEKPQDAGDLFEEYSQTIRRTRFIPATDHLQDIYARPQYRESEPTLRLLKTVQHFTIEKEYEQTPGETTSNLLDYLDYFEQVGVGLPRLEMFSIRIKIRHLIQTNRVRSCRFWGKVYGIYKDYIVVETEELDEDIKRALEEEERIKKEEDALRKEMQEALMLALDEADKRAAEARKESDTERKSSTAPKLSTAAKQSTIPKTSTAPKLSTAQKVSTASKLSTAPKVSTAPKASTASKLSTAPKVSKAPKASTASKLSTAPKTSSASKSPATTLLSSALKFSSGPKSSIDPKLSQSARSSSHQGRPSESKAKGTKFGTLKEEEEEFLGEEYDIPAFEAELRPPPEFPPLPLPNFEKPKPILPEKRGEGANRKVYYVCNEIDEEWVRLPDVTPEQIQISRKIRKLFTGELDTEIVGFPPFPGKEVNLLRAQIARIAATTEVSPKGFFKVAAASRYDEEEEEEEEEPEMDEAGEEGDRLGMMAHNKLLIVNPAYRTKGLEKLLNLNNWVHHQAALLEQGRTTFWSEKTARREAQGEEETFEEEEEEDEAEEGYQPGKVRPEKAIPLFRPISKDKCFNVVNKLWTIQANTKFLPECAVAVLKCDLWPGAFAFAAGRKFANIYVGWGHKYTPFNYSISLYPVPNVASEYPLGPEIMEMNDPTWEMEETWRAAHEQKPELEGEEEESGEESSEEEEPGEDD